MSRVHLALNVADLRASIDFYTRMFRTPPSTVTDGHAEFSIADPPLALALYTRPGEAGTVHHLGIEVGSRDDVLAAARQALGSGLEFVTGPQPSCCVTPHATTRVYGPDATTWDVYTPIAEMPAVLPGHVHGECDC
jgi:catechol 2,3-dioxygenase-like lactoylglutathione lyase family enzyme